MTPLHLWRIDNYQLLQRYDREKDAEDETKFAFPDDPSKYQRTNYYTGWRCAEKHLYFEIKPKTDKTVKTNGKEEKIVVNFPTCDAVNKSITNKDEIVKKEEEEKARLAEEQEAGN